MFTGCCVCFCYTASLTLLPSCITLHQALHALCQSADGCVSQLSRWVATTELLELLRTEPSLRLPPLSHFGYGQCQPQHRRNRQANQTRCQHSSHPRAVWSTLRLWRIIYTHTQRQRCCPMIPLALATTTTTTRNTPEIAGTDTDLILLQQKRKAAVHGASEATFMTGETC